MHGSHDSEAALRKLAGVRRHVTTLRIRRPLDEVFGFFSDVRKLEFIRPPGLDVSVLSEDELVMRDGARIDYAVNLHGVHFRWRSRILKWRPPFGFVDDQVCGPFSVWYHIHTFTDEGDRVRMDDEILYRLPAYPFGEVASGWVRREIGRIFDYRTHKIVDAFGDEAVETVFSGGM